MKDLRVVTWTHSSYSDIWSMYFEQFKKHAPFLKHAVFINEKSDLLPEEHMQVVNDENEAFYKRYLKSLEQIKEKYIIYMQEDFVLYGDVVKENIENVKSFLENSEYSFVRLIKSGVEGGVRVNDDLNIMEIPRNCPYIFSCNSAIWKKEEFIRLFDYYRPKSMLNSELYGSHACRSINIKGCYVYDNEPKRGKLHYDSKIFPYMSSALHGGSYGKPARWLTSHYEEELNYLFKEYNIDPSIRGTV